MRFLVAFLALPTAILAAPTTEAAAPNPPNFVMDSLACACQNPEGVVRSENFCLAIQGGNELPTRYGGYGGYCYRPVAWAYQMETVFTDAACKEWYTVAPEFNKAVCKPVKLCLEHPGVPGYEDYYKLC
ncbi:hypothetical protein C8A00DRAFT_37370 [Chaetomidium leptoderma]|uniref:Secreted protein n=1 Tax=Chaetomidium leptoderma TaxID=669021 RepID=A0AAN6ZTU4_9PEZI|nr:hypothetical protein C8A00DRAFT_37370 [Chaetomidium leptoderma]